MLLRGAYSAKYRAVQQEQVDNIRDEEREEFNVKLEKTKELSRDTNRRRRALEQRRKDYEAGEEKKRREILAQRRKEIQEATEKFQRANIVRTKRKPSYNNHSERSKSCQKVKHNAVPAEFVSKPGVNQVNGQPYYPSVEEVLAMLHADRAEVIERLVSSDNQQPEEPAQPVQPVGNLPPHSTTSYPNTYDVEPQEAEATPEQYLLDQERLRSEVVGRTQPKLAFGDHLQEVTEGVLPTTIRRDSPAGSLSSLDSLDEVPDEVPPPEFSGPLAGNTVPSIIRKPDKTKNESRVTFNENVVFNDGVVGALKKDDLVAGVSALDKQMSYFEIPSNITDRGKHDGMDTPGCLATDLPPTEPGALVSSSPTSVKPSASTSKPSQNSSVSKYPYVTVKRVKHGGDMPSYPVTADTVPGYPSTIPSYSDVLDYSGSVLSYNGVVPSYDGVVPSYNGAAQSYPGDVPTYSGSGTNYSDSVRTTTVVSVARTTPLKSSPRVAGKDVQQSSVNKQGFIPRNNEGTRGVGFYDSTIEKLGPEKSTEDGRSIQRNGDSQRGSGGITTVRSNSRVSFSSINASKLRDSLEMNHENLASHDDVTSDGMSQQPSRSAVDGDVLPETPLVPVTKKDFLSKALSRTSDHMTISSNDLTSRTSIPKQRPGTSCSPGKTDMSYTRTYVTGSENMMDTRGQRDYGSDTHKGRESGGVLGYNGTNDVGGPGARDTTKHTGYHGDQHAHDHNNNIRGKYGHSGIARTNSSKPPIAPDSRKHEVPSTRKNIPTSTNDSSNGSPVTNGHVGQQAHKRNNSDDLLKTVQADLEKITMAQSQRSTARAQSPTVPKSAATSANVGNRRSPRPSNHGRKTQVRKKSANGTKKKEEKRASSTTRRLHKPVGDSNSRAANGGMVNMQYASAPHTNQPYSTPNTDTTTINNRLPVGGTAVPDSESRPIESYSQHEPSWAKTFERKQRKNIDGIPYLDKTPTDEEINKLWETVRTCLKHEQSQKAASDSIVNTVRRSRSESGPMMGNHYLIDNQRWTAKPRPIVNAFGPSSPGSEPRVAGYVPFRRQNSLDGFQRRGSSESCLPQRKSSLLEHRNSRTERKLTRTRPPLSPQYLHTFRGPATSARGPQKSNTVKATEEPKRPQLSYAEFQTLMQASADIQMRNGETTPKRPQQVVHQPIIMDARKEPSALSLEEKRLLESLDRLNERLKVQEAVPGKIATKSQRSPNIPGSVSNMGNTSKLPQSNNRFTTSRFTSPSLLNRR